MPHTIHVLSHDCKGPNRACRSAHHQGRPVHMIPLSDVHNTPTLVMPTYHYATEDEGREAIHEALRTAPTVYGDADLAEYRERNIPHFLPVGWVDPTMRRDDGIVCVLNLEEF